MVCVEPRSTAIHDGSMPWAEAQRVVVVSPSTANFAFRLAPCSLLSKAVLPNARLGPLLPLTESTAALLVTLPAPLLTVTV